MCLMHARHACALALVFMIAHGAAAVAMSDVEALPLADPVMDHDYAADYAILFDGHITVRTVYRPGEGYPTNRDAPTPMNAPIIPPSAAHTQPLE